MNRNVSLLIASLAVAALAADPVFAHHVMDGRMPATFADGLLSGLGHPIIGIDHFTAVVAVGCIAAAHRAGWALALGYVAAMMAGVAAHLQGISVPAAEVLVALTVIGLGLLMLRKQAMSATVALASFVLVGLLHGYALGESIFGAERTPLYAYLVGLAVIQSVIALAAMTVTWTLTRKSAEPVSLRLLGAGVVGIGLAIFVQQVVPSA